MIAKNLSISSTVLASIPLKDASDICVPIVTNISRQCLGDYDLGAALIRCKTDVMLKGRITSEDTLLRDYCRPQAPDVTRFAKSPAHKTTKVPQPLGVKPIDLSSLSIQDPRDKALMYLVTGAAALLLGTLSILITN